MKIGIFTNNYLPNSFGVANSVEIFRKDFEKLGHTVYIFAPKWPGYTDENPNVFRYPSWDLEIKIKFPLAIPYSRRIDKIIEKLDLDIIHSQHPNLLGTAAAKWAKKKKIPLIFTWHTRYDLYTGFVPFIPPKISAGFMIGKARKYANKADRVIAPTDSMIPILKSWGVTNKNIIPVATGVSIEEFGNADGQKIRQKYEIKEDEILLFVISRFTAEKNMEFLFRSVIEVLKKNPKVRFMAGADGYLRPEIEKMVEENGVKNQVIFAGHLPDNIKKNHFAASDIFVFASKSETQGMVVLEAMYMGLPIVAVSATGTNSLVKNNVTGVLVDENEREFSSAVEKLVGDANLRRTFGEAARKIARENWTSEICAKKMLALYEEQIKEYKK